MNNNLFSFLDKRRVAISSEVKHNVISMGESYKGAFYIDSNDLEQFYELYIEAANNKIKLSIGEKPKEYGPILIDIDLKLNKDQYTEGTRLYNNEMIFLIIETYREAFKKYLSLESEYYDASLFEKQKPTIKENEIKDGFHIIFNKVIAHYKLRYLLREYVVNKLKDHKLFLNFKESVDKIIDKQVVYTNCWLLPGSKKPDGHKYRLTTIYKENNEEYKCNAINTQVKFYSILDNVYCKENESDFNDNYTFHKIEEEFMNIGNKNEVKQTENKTELKFKEGKTKEEFIERLVDILDDERADDWEKWRNVGFQIHHELNEIEIFDKFSQRSDKYNKKKVKTFWDSIKSNNDKPQTIKSLMKSAKSDNLEEYKLIIDEFILKEISIINNTDSLNESQDNYNKIKSDFEKYNFKVLNPIMYCTITDDSSIIQRTKKDFKDVYENLQYLKYNEYHKKFMMSSFVADWLKDPEMRTYDKLDFLPKQETPKNIYNTFSGFEAEKKELFDINIEETLLMKHIKNICGNNDEFTNYFINWLSNLVQKPLDISAVMVLFSSVQGVGKDSIFNYMGHKILGSKYYVNEDKPELLFGKFNSIIENKILIVINEASGKDTFKIDNNIKMAITRNSNTIEHKGLKPYEIKNCASYVGLSNNSVSFKIEPTDRRFTAQECNNDIANNTEYFGALYEELNSGKIDRAFYEYLNKRDINNYKFQDKRPQTKLYNDMKEACIPLLAKYFGNIIDDNQALNELSFKSNIFYTDFNNYIKAGNYKYETNLTQFGRELNDYKCISKIKKRDGIHYIINLIELKEHLIAKKLYNDNIQFIDDDDTDNESIISPLDKK